MTAVKRDRKLSLDARAFWKHYRGYHRAIIVAGFVSMVAALAELMTLAILATATSLIGERKSAYELSFAGATGSISVGQLLIVATALVLVRGGLTEEAGAAHRDVRFVVGLPRDLMSTDLDQISPV